MKILITGGNGQLAKSIDDIIKENNLYSCILFSKEELDITNIKFVRKFLVQYQPDIVINAAAYTKVDKAEAEESKAFLVNELGPKNLAIICNNLNILLVHFSTDYVFDGKKEGLWKEDDLTNPINVYGKSKLFGEKAITDNCSKYLILRTSWVFSDYPNNFVTSILRLAQENKELNIVSDQFGNPTSSYEIASKLVEILPKINNYGGIYNFAQMPSTNWADFAEVIVEKAYKRGILKEIIKINKIKSAEYPTIAARPYNSKLCTKKFLSEYNVGINSWHFSLEDVFDKLHKNK